MSPGETVMISYRRQPRASLAEADLDQLNHCPILIPAVYYI